MGEFHPLSGGTAMTRQIIGRKQLLEIAADLSERDLEILRSIGSERFLTTGQLTRLHFSDKPTKTAATRSANRALAKLKSSRLIDSLERRIGGVRAGSASYVWGLAPAGGRLLEITGALPERPKWVREYEPSRHYLEHTLALAEVRMRLREAERRGDFTILELVREPDCWRPYSAPGGGVARIKPDLALVTASGEFEDHWFIEIDLATERPARVLRTCLVYEEYRRTGTEQKRAGVFPVVVWVVPNRRRKEAVLDRLAEDTRISHGLFQVVLPDEFERLIKGGAPALETDHES
jgi:hypothetical protein